MGDPASLGFLVVQGVITAAAGRLAERGVDRLLDGRRQPVVVPEPPKRHRLGNVTSDVDIVVRHRPAGRRAVLLAFQTATGWEETEVPQGATVPMLLGETAHLTLLRDDYVISALVLEPAVKVGGKPVLHGIGRIRHWVASNATEQLAITTNPPSPKTLKKLGLLKPDGTSPFELPPAQPAAPPKQVTGAPAGVDLAGLFTGPVLARIIEANASVPPFTARPQCRAATSRFGSRCSTRIGHSTPNGLCQRHGTALNRGETVYDWSTRRKIT